MKLRATLDDKRFLNTTASNLSAQEFIDEARHRFPNPSPFMEEFLRRFEQLATADTFTAADHTVECPQCGTEMNLEQLE